MVKSKLLSVKKDKNIVLYQVFIDEEKLNKFLDLLDTRYGKTEIDIVETIFDGIVPLSYGKYDTMNDLCEIKDLGVVDNKKDKQSNDYYKTFGAASKEWDFLSLEEKIDYMPFQGTNKGKVKLEVYYPSILAKKLKNTFLTNDNECIIDGTELIKLYNHLYSYSNTFNFDKTIDLNSKKKRWNDPSRSFLSLNDYQDFLNNANKIINSDDIELTSKETKGIRNDIDFIISGLRRCIASEQIGMFPMDIELSDDLEILKRYAIRNEELNHFYTLFEYAPINYDGGKVLGDYHKVILDNYDLNGVNKEKDIIRKINNQTDIFKKLDENKNKRIDYLTKKIKTAA